MTPKVYEQAIGFMRIIDGKNPLDRTSIHPESYDAAIDSKCIGNNNNYIIAKNY